MGEKNRRDENLTPHQRVLQELSRKLADDGKLIEAGWIGLRMAAIPDDASEAQLSDMRWCFFAGALHLFSSMMSILEPGAEPTDKDLARMDLINEELKAFGEVLELRLGRPQGHA